MRTVAYGYLIGSGILLTSEAFPFVNPAALQFSALTILGWTVWYMLARAYPAHIRELREERKAAERERRKESRNTRQSLKRLAKAIEKLHQ